MSSSEVRVRFAPSPTGYLHVGGARTALYNYLYAKKHNGKFILRIEDTDVARSTEESLKMVIEDLQWLGLRWDEGPDPVTRADVGGVGPYKQSQRLAVYKKFADQLIQAGKAYFCFMTDEEIEQQREKLKASGQQPHVESPYESWPLEKALAKIKEGGKPVVRFKTRQLKKDYVLHDLIRGDVRFPSDMVGDFVLLRSDGMPVYNFCCVVDDHEMKMSHILRAEEHLPNTLRQMMIYEGLGWQMPQFGHISLVLDEDRQKMSKRKGATSCHEFKMEGFLPEALLNYIALLGWSHPSGNEILSLAEMIDGFDLKRVNPAGAVFDILKLKWVNATHLRAKSDQEIWQLVNPFLQRAGLKLPDDPAWQERSVGVFKSRMEILSEAVELYRPLSKTGFEILPETDEAYAWETTGPVLKTWKELISQAAVDYLSEEQFNKIQDEVKTKTGAKGKNLFMAIRIAVIGKLHGADLKILVPLIDKKTLLERADLALAKVKA